MRGSTSQFILLFFATNCKSNAFTLEKKSVFEVERLPMKKPLPFLYYVFIFCCFFPCLIQAQELHLDHFSLEEGLSNSGVQDLLQDQYGFLWIATEHGLNRYDGYDITVFRYHPSDTTSINANFVSRIFESPSGQVWTVLAAGGLSRFNRATESFEFFAANHQLALDRDNFVQSLFFSRSGDTWVATSRGIHIVDEKRKVYTPVIPVGWEEKPFMVIAACEDADGTFWLGTNKGLYHFDPATRQMEQMSVLQEDTLALIHHQVFRVIQDQAGRIWAGTIRGGLLASSPDKCTFVHPIAEDTGSSIVGLTEDKTGNLWASFWEKGIFIKKNGASTFIRLDDSLALPQQKRYTFLDGTNRMWILTPTHQLTYLDLASSTSTQLTITREGFNNSQMIRPTAIATSPSGVVWIGTTGDGFYQLRPSRQKFTHFKKWGEEGIGNNDVVAILRDQQDRLWIGTGQGLRYMDPTTGNFKMLYTSDHLELRYIRALMEDRNQRLWVAHTAGITILNAKREVAHSIQLGSENRHALLSGNIWSIYEDKGGNIWVCTDRGLHRWEEASQQFHHYFREWGNPHTFSCNHFRCLIQDDEGVYWVGNVVGKMNKMTWDEAADTMWVDQFNYEVGNKMTVNAIYEDRQGHLWVGGYSRGLLLVDKNTLKMKRVLGEDRAPIPNIAGIIEDETNNLWISANDGLYRFCPSTLQLKKFDMADGLQNDEFNIGTYFKDSYGKLYFGGINGFNCFFPEEIQPDPPVPPPILTQFNVLGHSRSFEQPLAEVESIRLDHTENFFSLSFVSLGFNHRLRTRYAYRLKGLDPDWVVADQARKATYSNLPPGSYTFQVKAANHDGEWASKMAQVAIHIRPPFWQTAWFSILLVSLLIAGLLLAHRLRLQAKLNKLHEIQQVRQTAAADFHDEMGHKLTRISLLTEVIERKGPVSPKDLSDYLRKIKDNSGALYHTMRDFLWALDPARDSVFELAVLLKDFGDELFDNSGMAFRVSGLDPYLEGTILPMDWKRHLVLIFKEAMHNSLKYAQGKNVWLAFSLTENRLTVKLVDDGNGFFTNNGSTGYGIRNMYNRAKQLNCTLSITSQPGKGAQIHFEGNIP